MRKTDISVVIPVYNGADTISDALDSVLCQTAVKAVREVIVINDASEEDTTQIIKKWDEANPRKEFRLILHEFKTNRGVSAARNKGIELSSQNLVAFLDADDKWMPDKLKIQLNILRKYPEIKALGTGWDKLNLKPGKQVKNSLGYDLRVMDIKTELLYFWPSAQSMIIDREELLKLGGFDESMRYAEDGDLLCRLAEKCRIYYVCNELVSLGHGKNPFGEKGLSANLKAMHKGFQKTVKGCLKRGRINAVEYVFFLLWEEIKYIRRLRISAGIKRSCNKAPSDTANGNAVLSLLKRFAKICLALLRFIKQRTFLKSIEFQIVDHCNLNCRGCSHFSNISEKRFIDARVLTKCFDKLNSHIGYVYSVALMGGEPLLHPDLIDIMQYCRDRFPLSEIRIVTNGLLLDKMPEEFYRACHKNRILIYISKYPPTINKLDKIKEILSLYQVRYFISSTVREFSVCLNPEGTSDMKYTFEHCGRKSCTIVRDDHIYVCPISAYIDKYNKRFGQNIPQPEGLNLYDCSTDELLEYLKNPVRTCSYCTSRCKYINWSCSGDPDKTDWYGKTDD